MASDQSDASNVPARRPMSQAISSAARAHLECTRGPEKGQTFRIAPGATVIGRDDSCDIVLSESAISRQHFRIERTADAWVIRNLSSNGSILNRKPVDEAILSDGDEIRIGVKTRFVFVVEEVAKLAAGRPQFRARVAGREDEQEGAEAEDQEEEPSLFKRRKGLFIGLGAYVVVILVIAVILAVSGPKAPVHNVVLRLDLDDTIIPEPGADPLPILRQKADGWEVRDARGGFITVPQADLDSGKAKRTTGIRRAIDVKFLQRSELKPDQSYPFVIESRDPTLGDRDKKLAIEAYLIHELPGKEAELLRSVRLFQRALGYYGTGAILGDPKAEKIRQEALQKLTNRVHEKYTRALLFEKTGDDREAWQAYQQIIALVPEIQNPIFQNVSQRAGIVRKRMEAKRQR